MSGTFVSAAVILLREGLEALLVVAALAAYLEKAGGGHRLTALYAGAAAAVAASFVAAWVFQTFYGGGHNDLLEGVVMLAAAGLMIYVALWMFQRRDPKLFQAEIKTRTDAALAQDTGFAVAALAFFAVFREGAETILFVHALAGSDGGYSAALFGGLIAAALALTVLFFVINVAARRIPLRPLFTATSVLLFLMALKFIGQALQEFQEQQFVSFTPVAGGDWLETIGLNPTWEALNIQGVVLIAVIALAFLLHRRSATPQAVQRHS